MNFHKGRRGRAALPLFFCKEDAGMPKIFETLDKVRPVYDIVYKVVLFICKLLLIAEDRKSVV